MKFDATKVSPKKANSKLWKFTQMYQPFVPMEGIFKAVREGNMLPVQEDGTPWQGVLCGDDGDARINLTDMEHREIDHLLVLTWHRMEQTGTYEVNCYVS